MSRLTRTRRKRGGTVVESTLILFVFLVMIIGILDFGHFLFLHQALVERVRAGVRYGVVNAYDATKVKNMVVYGQPTPSDGQTGFLGLTAQMVTVQREDATNDNDRVIVTVSGYPIKYFSPLMAKVANNLPISATLPYEYE